MKKYTIIFLLLLVTEIAIAVFHFHRFVRGFIGDVLVIPLLFAFLKMVTNISSKNALYLVLVFAFVVEIAQYFSISELLGIHNRILTTVIGTQFDPLDLVAYLFGILPVLFIENYPTHGKD